MKRWIACGVAVGWVAGASAAEPVPISVYPPTPKVLAIIPPAPAPVAMLPGTMVPAPAITTRPVIQNGMPDVTRPLSSVLDAAAPSAPTLSAPTVFAGGPGSCVGGCGPTCGPVVSGWRIPKLSLGSTPCLDKLRCWFAWKSGPRVLPACTPTPYQPPLRHYFPVTAAPNLATAPACAPAERAPFFGPRLLNLNRCGVGGCKDGCGRGRCDGCHESVVEKAVSCLTPRQFGRTQPNCWTYPGAPAVSGCATGYCDGTTAAAIGAVPVNGGVYPGLGGGYRFASPVFVPPAQAVTASPPVGAGAVGVSSGAVSGTVGAVVSGTPAAAAAAGK